MSRKLLILFIALAMAVPSFADDLMDSTSLNMRHMDNLNMGNVMPNYTGTGSFSFPDEDDGSYNLSRMKQMNPDFTTYPEAQGIIWLKHDTFSRSEDGGTEVTRLYVILGRQGLGGKWLNWNIPIPEKGSTKILEANVYDFNTLAKIGTASTNEDNEAGVMAVNFAGLPGTFIIALSWRESLPEQLSIEGVSWFQEKLRVWEAILEIYSPQKLSYTTFPDRRSPETEELGNDTAYTWRRINVEPYSKAGELSRTQRAGAVFGTRQGNSGLAGMLKDAENAGSITAPSEALSEFKRSKKDGASRLITWLSSQPEITLADGSPRRIPSSGAWTRREKVLLAKYWLNAQKVDTSICWKLPFEPDDRTPVCPAMFYDPVLDVQNVKGVEFNDMGDTALLAGAKVYAPNADGRLISRRIPSSKSSENRLSAVMNLKLSEQGTLNGDIRVILRGGWSALLLGNNPTDGMARGAVLSLFPGLADFHNVKYRNVKGTPEISLSITNKHGIAGSNRGILAIPPVFEPVSMRKLANYEPPVEIIFPFIVEQNITIELPKNAKEALVSGKTSRNPDKINYSDNAISKRHRLELTSRFELNMQTVSSGNMALLRRNLDSWHAFSTRLIPVR